MDGSVANNLCQFLAKSVHAFTKYRVLNTTRTAVEQTQHL